MGRPCPRWQAAGGSAPGWQDCTWWVVAWDSGSVRVRGVAATRSKTTWSRPARMSRHGGGGQRHTTAGACRATASVSVAWRRHGRGAGPVVTGRHGHGRGTGSDVTRRLGHGRGTGPVMVRRLGQRLRGRATARGRPRRCQGSPAGRCPALQDSLASATPVRGCISDRGGGKTTALGADLTPRPPLHLVERGSAAEAGRGPGDDNGVVRMECDAGNGSAGVAGPRAALAAVSDAVCRGLHGCRGRGPR